ncbi:hypothetical protein PCIT_a3802 [Pseudoalteromonas citrea]|uniref:Uncharacterized protein n=1 Tax=Pseudoalteromonas citrea TaxID=43655 RepID=A0AAD4AGB0_9GAMM|nr:hypothetical protein PCIT_a3802 [Pseudoalteromonas citrea]
MLQPTSNLGTRTRGSYRSHGAGVYTSQTIIPAIIGRRLITAHATFALSHAQLNRDK